MNKLKYGDVERGHEHTSQNKEKSFEEQFPSLWKCLMVEINIDLTSGLPFIAHPEEVALRIKIFKGE